MAMPGAVWFVSGARWDCAKCVLMQRQLSPGPGDRGIACSPSVIWRFMSAYFPAAGACTGSCYGRVPAEADRGRLEAWQGSCLALHDSLKRRPPSLGVRVLHARSSSPGPSSGGLAAQQAGRRDYVRGDVGRSPRSGPELRCVAAAMPAARRGGPGSPSPSMPLSAKAGA